MKQWEQCWESVHQLVLDGWLGAEGDDRHAYAACLGELYQASDERFDALVSLRQARTLIRDRVELETASVWSEIDQRLADTERAAALLGPPRPRPVPEIMAAHGTPPSRAIDRPVLVPPTGAEPALVVVDEISEKPPGDAFVNEPIPPFSAGGWSQVRLEQFLSDISAVLGHRVPQMGDHFRSMASVEARLLSLLDATHALTVDWSHLERAYQASPCPDPQLLAGIAFVLGTMKGRDALAVVERCYGLTEDEEGFTDALEETLVHLPNPAIDSLAGSWIGHQKTEKRALGYRLLARRAGLSKTEFERAFADHPVVSEGVFLPLIFSGLATKDNLGSLLSAHSAMTLPLLAGSVLIAPERYSHEVLRQCHSDNEQAARLVGSSCSHADAQQLLEWACIEPRPAVVDALGWAGDPAVLPLLLNLLANDDRDVVFSAAGALERITGAGLTEEIEIPAEEVMGGATSSSSPAAPNAQDANDPGETPSPDLIELPSTNQEQWRSFLEENQGRFLPGVRMRAGRQYTPLVSLDLLEFSPASPADRRALHWEIVTRTGYLVPFDVTAFVPVQDERLRQIRSLIQARSWNEGVWELPMTRQTFSPPSALSS